MSVSKMLKSVSKMLKSILLSAYILGIIIAIFATIFSNEYHRRSEITHQKKEALYMLENISLEMEFNISKIERLITEFQEAYQDTLLITHDLFLNTGAYRAAIYAGQLRYIPNYAFALMNYYDRIERVNKRLDNIIRLAYTKPLGSIDGENLKRYIDETSEYLRDLKELLSKVKGRLDNSKRLIVENKCYVEPFEGGFVVHF